MIKRLLNGINKFYNEIKIKRIEDFIEKKNIELFIFYLQ